MCSVNGALRIACREIPNDLLKIGDEHPLGARTLAARSPKD